MSQSKSPIRIRACAFARRHELIPFLRVALRGPRRNVARDLMRRLLTSGALTARQVAYLRVLGTTSSSPAPSGKCTFTARIEMVRKENTSASKRHTWGYKLTVRADDGYRAWLTAPAALLDAVQGDGERLAGRRVEITTTLTPSRNDPGFAFGKRPTVRLIDESAAA